MVTINSLPLSHWGLKEIRFDNGLSIKGLFDMPKRKGETERNWGNGIEAFLDTQDIAFDGRNISLRVLATINVSNSLNSFSNYLKTAGQFILGTGFGNLNVVFKDEMKVQKTGGYATAVVEFWQNSVSFLAPSNPSGGNGFLIDAYNFKNFGISVLKSSGHLDTPKRIEVNTTEFYSITQYRNVKELSLECLMKGTTKADFWNKLNTFYGLLASPSARLIKLHDGTLFAGYVKDGVEVKNMAIMGLNVYAEMSIKFREVQT